MRALRLCTLLMVWTWSPCQATAQQMSNGELHDRIVAVMARRIVLPPATDTFVSWEGRGPVLYHTVTRWSDSIRVGLQRNDSLFGTTTVRFANGRVRAASVRWVDHGVLQRAVEIEVAGDTVLVRDSVRRAFVRPTGLWTVADYGMDDLLVAVLQPLPSGTPQMMHVLRPYGLKWDSLTVRVSDQKGARTIEVVSAPDDTSRFVVADDGTLVQELRSKYPANERRPLEETRAFALYLTLRTRR